MARPIVFVVAACGVIATAPVLAQDVVRFGGGDQLTGEIKGLERGKLSFDTCRVSRGAASVDLDLRRSIGGAGGRILRQSNSNRIQLIGGIVLTEERASATLESREDSTVEGLFGADLEWFSSGRSRSTTGTKTIRLRRGRARTTV